MDLPAFNPTSAQTDAVLDALADPTRSLLNIAAANNTSIRALSAWLQGAEIRSHAELIDDALTRRARSQAAAAFPAVIAAATKAIESFNTLPAPDLADRALDPAAADRYRRHCQSALRAAWILLRIARFDATPRRHPPHDTTDTTPGRRRAERAPNLTELAALLEVDDALCHHPPPQRAIETQRAPAAAGGAEPTAPSLAPAACRDKPIAPLPLFTPEGVLGAHARNPARSPRTAAHLAATAGLASGP